MKSRLHCCACKNGPKTTMFSCQLPFQPWQSNTVRLASGQGSQWPMRVKPSRLWMETV